VSTTIVPLPRRIRVFAVQIHFFFESVPEAIAGLGLLHLPGLATKGAGAVSTGVDRPGEGSLPFHGAMLVKPFVVTYEIFIFFPVLAAEMQ
jgi:hypothetical protein